MRMRAALAAHDEVLREAIEAHGGFLFKHTGDGVCAAFASPVPPWMLLWPRSGRWSCRCGWGWRPARPNCAAADYFGAVLNRAARVMAAGHGGQVLLADVDGGLLSGVDLLDLGPRRLRDLPTPVGVFQVRAEGLRTKFPPLAGARHESGKSAVSDARASSGGSPRLAEVQARGEVPSVGHVDRRGRGRQDPPGDRGRCAAGR